jgi:hypothetical protein
MDQDTIHLLFPNINKLLNFQRKFLIRLESTGELPWKDQRWGQLFLENVSHLNISLAFLLYVLTHFLLYLLFHSKGKRIHRIRAILR